MLCGENGRTSTRPITRDLARPRLFCGLVVHTGAAPAPRASWRAPCEDATMMTRDEAEVLAANEAFYTLFASRDLAAMEQLWAKSHAVTCIHPGWSPLMSRASVISSWR